MSPAGRLLFAVSCATLLLAAWMFRRHVVDDAWISYRYAENLAAGLGYVFNPGERVEGASNLLWVLILAGARALGGSPLVVSQVLAVLAGLTTLAVQVALSTRLGDGRPSSIAPWLTSLSVPFAVWTVAGLETTPYACALVAATGSAGGDLADGRGRARTAVLYLVVSMLRPEGALFAAPYLGFVLLRVIRGRTLWRAAWLPLVVFGAGIALVTVWRWTTFHALVPNTFFAKVDLGAGAGQGLQYLARWGLSGAGFALVVALIPWMNRRARWSPTAVLLWWAIALQLAFVVAVGGDWMPAFRFMVPILPMLHVLAGAGVAWVWKRMRSRLGPGLARAAAALIAALTVVASAQGARQQRAALEPYVAGLERAHVALGRWLRTAAPTNARLALSDCGALPYHSGLRTIDLLGLTDAWNAHRPAAAVAQRVVHELRPELIVLGLSYVPGPPPSFSTLFGPDAAIAADPTLAADWRLVGIWPFAHYDLYLFARRDVTLRGEPPSAGRR